MFLIESFLDSDLDNIYSKKEGVLLILFHSPSCAPCKKSMNMFEDMKTVDSINNTPISFLETLTDNNPKCVEFFNVRSLPFVVVINTKSKTIISKGGLLSYREYENLINESLSFSS